MDEAKEEEEDEEDDFQSAKADDSASSNREEDDGEAYLENMQAFSYNRDFMLKGPVIQVFSREEDHSAKYQMKFPELKDHQGDLVRPQNLVLQGSEN